MASVYVDHGPCWLCISVLVICASFRDNPGCAASASSSSSTSSSTLQHTSVRSSHHVPRQPLTLIKKTAYNPVEHSDYPDYSAVKYDEYPVVVPKRAALLLDRIMVALQKAVDDENAIPGSSASSKVPLEETMDLQRRGNQKNGRIYWRCYFNAVTCF